VVAAKILALITGLCNVHPASQITNLVATVDKHQLYCQKYYVRCIRKKKKRTHATVVGIEYAMLEQCVLERTVK